MALFESLNFDFTSIYSIKMSNLMKIAISRFSFNGHFHWLKMIFIENNRYGYGSDMSYARNNNEDEAVVEILDDFLRPGFFLLCDNY